MTPSEVAMALDALIDEANRRTTDARNLSRKVGMFNREASFELAEDAAKAADAWLRAERAWQDVRGFN